MNGSRAPTEPRDRSSVKWVEFIGTIVQRVRIPTDQHQLSGCVENPEVRVRAGKPVRIVDVKRHGRMPRGVGVVGLHRIVANVELVPIDVAGVGQGAGYAQSSPVRVEQVAQVVRRRQVVVGVVALRIEGLGRFAGQRRVAGTAGDLDAVDCVTDVAHADGGARHFVQLAEPHLQLVHARRQPGVQIAQLAAAAPHAHLIGVVQPDGARAVRPASRRRADWPSNGLACRRPICSAG